MCEKIRWGIAGMVIGLGVSAVVVATNKKVQKTISSGTDKVVDTFNDVKDVATQTVKSIKKKTAKPTATKSTSTK